MNGLDQVRPVQRKVALQNISKRGAWILLGIFGGLLVVFFLCLFLGFPGFPLNQGK